MFRIPLLHKFLHNVAVLDVLLVSTKFGAYLTSWCINLHCLSDFCLSVLGKEIKPVQSAKDPGIILDLHFTFDHIVKSVSSCMASLAQINSVKYALNKDLLVTVIQSLVRSKMYYCSTVWSNTNTSNICKLQAVQNFAARIINNSKKFDRITPLLHELRWIPVKSYLFYRDAVMINKCINGTAPYYLSLHFV